MRVIESLERGPGTVAVGAVPVVSPASVTAVAPASAATPAPEPAGPPATLVPQTAARLERADLVGGFRIPPGGEAGTPPELRRRGPDARIGSDARSDVRLMVAHRETGQVAHRRFTDLPDELAPGDVVVVNASAVVPAALDARGPDHEPFRLHLSTEQPGGFWVVEPRLRAGAGSERFRGEPPRRLTLPGGAGAELLAPYPAATPVRRLWLAQLDLPDGLLDYLAAHGQPIRYAHTDRAWPISAYQTVFSRVPGSVEMPSAARPFTDRLVSRLVAGGVTVVPIVLHTGVSSQEAGEPPYAERFEVPAATADIVNAARAAGRRIIAAGTTAVRALESTADGAGRSHPGQGWTELVVSPQRGVRLVDGLITGWHEPESSHLAMLEAIAGRPLLEASYAEAVAERYRWHEFGDSHLILP